jgi:glycosyltransferase involved in cell wall biosynthesis
MALKILLVSEYFFPKSTGGTELYVYNLAMALIELGNNVVVLCFI